MAYKNVEDRKAASRRHYQANKVKYLDRNKKYRKYIHNLVRRIKATSPCADCGNNYPYYVMDFDHLDGSTKDNLVSFFAKTGRIAALKNEIKKCEVVCSNCHRMRTYQRLGKVEE